MTEIYFTPLENLESYLAELLGKYAAPVRILKTAAGKPYIEGDPVYFSIAHSAGRAAISLCDRPVGIDYEVFRGKSRKAVYERFPARERTEISDERDFLLHWTAREAFIKMKGETLASCLKRLEFYRGDVYLDGEKQKVKICAYEKNGGVVCVCAEE